MLLVFVFFQIEAVNVFYFGEKEHVSPERRPTSLTFFTQGDERYTCSIYALFACDYQNLHKVQHNCMVNLRQLTIELSICFCVVPKLTYLFQCIDFTRIIFNYGNDICHLERYDNPDLIIGQETNIWGKSVFWKDLHSWIHRIFQIWLANIF